MEIEESLRLSLLTEIYCGLLTSKQYEVMRGFLDSNLSLSELALENNSTRQAVNDLVKRTIKILESYEDKLHLYQKFENVKKDVESARELLKDKKINISLIDKKLQKILEVL